jgi:hypothetical protein
VIPLLFSVAIAMDQHLVDMICESAITAKQAKAAMPTFPQHTTQRFLHNTQIINRVTLPSPEQPTVTTSLWCNIKYSQCATTDDSHDPSTNIYKLLLISQKLSAYQRVRYWCTLRN